MVNAGRGQGLMPLLPSMLGKPRHPVAEETVAGIYQNPLTALGVD
jgi:hypothetical protein